MKEQMRIMEQKMQQLNDLVGTKDKVINKMKEEIH